MNEFWNNSFLNNTVTAWLIALLIVAAGFAILSLVKRIVIQKLKGWTKNTSTSLDDFILTIMERSIIPLLYVVIVFTAIHYLTVPPKIMKIISVAMGIAVLFFILRIITAVVKYFIFSAIQFKEESEERKKQARGLILLINFIIWSLGLVFLIDNLGYDIGTLIAGLGIGGIAIALAAQTILGDVFSYFIIYFDRPFEIGDFIALDDRSGVVEQIGLKTTRIRTLTGDQLICSNKDLTDSRLNNYGDMQKRRVVFSLRIAYQTSREQIKKVPVIIKNIITGDANTTFDRAHFSSIGTSSFDFEVVYYLMSADYNAFMDTQQDILLKILQSFEEENIRLAYPAQTLFIKNQAFTAEIPPHAG